MLAIIVALIVARECGRHEGRAEARQTAVDARNDSVAVVLRREAADSQKAFTARGDSLGREIRRLKGKIAQGANLSSVGSTAQRGSDSADVSVGGVRPRPDGKMAPEASCASAPAQCDTLIAALTAGRAQDSLQLLFWKAQVTSYRDTVVPALTRGREAWKAQAQKPRYTMTDVAGAGLVGWGLARDDGNTAKAGIFLLVVPRLYQKAKEIL